MSAVTIRYGDDEIEVDPSTPFVIGSGGDLVVDDNPHLHRRLLCVTLEQDTWWVANIGQAIPVSIATEGGEFQALLGPGGRLPIVFPRMRAMFTAGPVTYELSILCPTATMAPADPAAAVGAGDPEDPTHGPISLTESQRLLVLALAEAALRAPTAGLASVPTSAVAAERLGWPLTTFNRKLDAVCEKLDRAGVDGLRGGPGQAAAMRKARLVEYALLARLVTADDLALLGDDELHTSDETGRIA